MENKEVLYTKEHEWIKFEGKIGKVGITDYAQSSLGDIVFVELPEVGRKVKQFETCGTIESIKAASDIFSPISGKIIEVNENLKETPEIINKSPYESWLFKIEVEDEKEKENLMNEVEYQQYIKNL